MFESIKNRRIASFKLGGERIDLTPAEMIKSADSYSKKVGDLLVILNFEEVTTGFYRWTVILRNTGKENTPQITDFYGMDLEFPLSGKASWESLHGDTCDGMSYYPRKRLLNDGTVLNREPMFGRRQLGRSSRGDHFPYFDISSELGSAIFAIGWTGQWKYELARTGNSATLKAGFADCDMYLAPDEWVRSIGAIVYEGGELMQTRRDFRRIFREKLSPAAKTGGKMHIPLSLQVFDRYFWTQREAWASEEGQLHCIKCAEKLGSLDTYWLDAAWFRDGFPHGVGNYEIEKTYPNGLAPVSAAAKKSGLAFMLWFEPERVDRGSDLGKYHPEFLLSDGDEKNENLLYNLADETAYAWLRDTLIGMIRDNGIDIYRQDFNMDPLEYWRHNDKDGKKGYLENKYITGLYRLWDDILAAFPSMMIDNCSSGGCRLDFEMNLRGVPMWRSDTGCFPSTEERPTHLWHQNQTMGLSRYLPYYATATWTTEAYTLRSALSMGLACNLDVMSDDFDAEEAQKPLREFHEIRDLWEGDFYPLTRATIDDDVWAAFQLADGERGFCLFFRRESAEADTFTFDLHAIDETKDYEVILSDEKYERTSSVMKGSDLISFTANIPEAHGSLLLIYKAI